MVSRVARCRWYVGSQSLVSQTHSESNMPLSILRALRNGKGATIVTPQAMVDAGLVKRKKLPIKILGNGELKKALVVQAHKFSKSAESKIQAAGGRVEVIGGA